VNLFILMITHSFSRTCPNLIALPSSRRIMIVSPSAFLLLQQPMTSLSCRLFQIFDLVFCKTLLAMIFLRAYCRIIQHFDQFLRLIPPLCPLFNQGFCKQTMFLCTYCQVFQFFHLDSCNTPLPTIFLWAYCRVNQHLDQFLRLIPPLCPLFHQVFCKKPLATILLRAYCRIFQFFDLGF
jgi:hypothetical protein